MKNYCKKCNGSGQLKKKDPSKPLWFFKIKIVCPYCNGCGYILPPKERPLIYSFPPPNKNEKD